MGSISECKIKGYEHIVTVYDMVKHQYRSIDLNRLKSLRCGKIEYKAED